MQISAQKIRIFGQINNFENQHIWMLNFDEEQDYGMNAMKKLIVLVIACLLTTSCLDQLCYSGKWTTKDITDGSTISGTFTFYAAEKPTDVTVLGSDGKNYPDSASIGNNDNGNGFGYKITIDTTKIPNGKTSITLSINSSACDMDALPPNPTTIEVTVQNG